MINKKNFWRGFWLTFLFVSLGYAWYSFYTPADKLAWLTDESVAKSSSLKSGKPVLIFVTAKWCVPCRIMKRTVLNDAEVLKVLEEKFTPLLIDFDDPRHAPFVSLYQIRGTPVTLVTDSEGKLMRYVSGGVGRAEFLKFLSP